MTAWAVVGTGDIVRKRVMAAIRNDARSRMRAVVTRNPERSSDLCEQYGIERVYQTLEEALADPEVQAVYVATPVALHYPQTMAALAAGKHVLCEKPTALNPRQVEAMVAAARAMNRHFAVAYYRRLYPAVVRANELLRAGVIGQPVLAWVCHHAWFDETLLSHRAWLFDPAVSGGGPLMDVGSHRIDLLNYIFGEPHLLSAAISQQTHHTPGFLVEDNATLMLDYTGVRALLDVRWNSRIDRDDFRIIGTEGEMDLTPLNHGKIRITGKNAREESHPPHDNFHVPMVAHFLDVLEAGAELISSGESALATDRIIAEAYGQS